MKKILMGLVICFTLLLGVHVVTVSQVEYVRPVAAVQVMSAGDVADEAEAVTETENNTFLGRIWEWVTNHKTLLFTATGDSVLGILFFFVYKRLKRVWIKIVGTTDSYSEVVGAVNNLITVVNKLERVLSDVQCSEEEREETIAATAIQTHAMLKILTTVYSNSKNLPQGVKDLVSLEYAKARKVLEEDAGYNVDEKSPKEDVEDDKNAPEK